MPHITAPSGVSWFYTDQGQGPNLVFIHGWSVNRNIWKQQVKSFANCYRVICVDLPGHGQSGWGDVTLESMTEDLVFIFKELGLKDINFVGSSFGGVLALQLCKTVPELSNTITLVGSMPKFYQSDGYSYGISLDRKEKLLRQMLTGYPTVVHAFFRSLFTIQERETRRFKWLMKFRKTDFIPPKQILLSFLEILEYVDLRADLSFIHCPVQLINGTGDEICDRRTVSYWKELLPTAKFHDMENCGHFPFLSVPHKFNMLLEDFLVSVNGKRV